MEKRWMAIFLIVVLISGVLLVACTPEDKLGGLEGEQTGSKTSGTSSAAPIDGSTPSVGHDPTAPSDTVSIPVVTDPTPTQSMPVESTAEHAHVYEWQIKQEMTCGVPEIKEGTCACGDIKQEITPGPEHQWGPGTIVIAAICDRGAYAERYCSNCSMGMVDTQLSAWDEYTGWTPYIYHTDNGSGMCSECGSIKVDDVWYIRNPDGASWRILSYTTTPDFGSGSTELVLPSQLQGKAVTEISMAAFCQNEIVDYMGGIQQITVSEGIRSIGMKAFMFCMMVDTVYLPSSLEYIGAQAFYGCYSLKDVHYAGTVTQWEKLVENRNIGHGFVIHCMDGDIEI